jgi:ATP:ADP antiporter, AAA family
MSRLIEIFLTVFPWVLSATLIALAIGAFAAWRGNPFAFGLLQRVVKVERPEVGAMFVAALYFFFTLTSYSILRPIRDEMAVATGVRDLPKLYLWTLISMLALQPMYGALVSRLRMKRFVTLVYQFFALNLGIFFVMWRLGLAPTVVQRVFFTWLSVFNLFVVSVFWGVMADSFESNQAKRLFGFCALGGTLGFVTGSSITAFFTQQFGVSNLFLISACMLLIAATLVRILPKRTAVAGSTSVEEQAHSERAHEEAVIGGGIWAGAVHVLRSPYLLGIAGFLFLYTFGSTVMYSAQTDIIGQFYTDRTARTQLLARMELGTQLITAFGQMFLTGRAMRWFGLSVTLAAVPAVSILGFAALGATGWGTLPLLATFIVFNIARRSTEFTLTNPSRKVLFTVLTREDKYKASTFLETFVYRGGDQVAVWSFAGLAGLGLALSQISWIAVLIAVPYLALGVWLGKRQRQMALERQPAPEIPVAA